MNFSAQAGWKEKFSLVSGGKNECDTLRKKRGKEQDQQLPYKWHPKKGKGNKPALHRENYYLLDSGAPANERGER